MPLPRSRNVVPVACPPGTLSGSGSPSSVGTLISPPSASVVKSTRHLAEEVVAVAPEERVLLHVDDDVEIAGRAAGRAVLAFALEPEPLAGRDAGGDLDRELALLRARGPAPRHVWHGLAMILPVPRHWPQVRATVKKPC